MARRLLLTRQVMTPLHILVIDDSLELAECFARVLEESGHRAGFVINPLDALDAAEGMHAEVVFIDIDMPGIDGWELAHLFRRRFGPAVRLVAVTGVDRPPPGRVSYARFDAYLVKPVSLERLLDAAGRSAATITV